MTKLDIWNNALALTGQAVLIESEDEKSYECELCKRFWPNTLKRCLMYGNFSFSRKDEVITKEMLLEDVISLPWKYSYSLPKDVLKIIRLTALSANSLSETIDNNESLIRFNFRNYNDELILVTDAIAPFVIQYQATTENLDILNPDFITALEHSLAGAIAKIIIKDTKGLQIGMQLEQLAMQYLAHALALDSNQGAYSIKSDLNLPLSIRARF